MFYFPFIKNISYIKNISNNKEKSPSGGEDEPSPPPMGLL